MDPCADRGMRLNVSCAAILGQRPFLTLSRQFVLAMTNPTPMGALLPMGTAATAVAPR